MSLAVRHFEVVREIPLSRAAVWHVLSHTDRLNRHVGLTPVTYGDLNSDEGGFYRAARAKVAGVALKWREYPFEWENDGRYSVVRLYDGGPIERFEGGIELEDAGQNATKLTVFSDMIGRGAVGKALLPLIARPFLQKTLAFCDQFLDGADQNPQPQGPQPPKSAVDEGLLCRLILDLKKRPVNENDANALAVLLREGGDGEVADLRPYEWAKSANLDSHQALRTCLHGVKAGLLNLRWTMMCPNCRVSKSETAHLDGLADAVHCDTCGVGFDLNFDRYVELRFAVHPAVRRASAEVFCLSGPFAARHILVQKCIEPGEIASFPHFSSDQTMRLRVLRSNQTIEIAPGALNRPHFRFDGQNWNAARARENQPAEFLAIENDTREVVCVALEKTEWDELAVTAARVTMLQEFRDLFSSQVLKPGRQVAVENVTLFFSDLSNSTSLYEAMGDAPAFGRVGSHFDFLTQHIARNNGAVVKTMGDAVMAVFHSPEDAVRAALEIQREFRYFSDTLDQDGHIGLKIGLHHGPALAVNSNERLDYFGRTVNIASRVAGASRQGDFVLTGEVWEFAAVQRLLIEAGAKMSRFEANLRGVEQTFALVRVRV